MPSELEGKLILRMFVQPAPMQYTISHKHNIIPVGLYLVKITNLYQWCWIWWGRRKSHHHKATKGNQIEKFHLFSVNVTVGLAFILKMGELEILPKYSNLELFSAFWYQKLDTSVRGNCSALQGSKFTCKIVFFFVQNFITHWNVEI